MQGIAERYDITRADADGFSLRSHQKAVAAMDAGKFDAEIVPVTIGELEHVRPPYRLDRIRRHRQGPA